jgi:tripartite-type tricarboxylate transporter receptor subunit TctC
MVKDVREKYLAVFILIVVWISILPFIVEVPEARGAGFPERTVTFICPQSAGGTFDTYSRLLAPYLKKYLPSSVNVVVENVTGGGYRVGLSRLLNSRPDGYTIGMFNLPGNVVTQIEGGVDWDLMKTTWIGKIADAPYIGALSAKSKLKNLEDMKKAEVVKVGTTGVASSAGLSLVISCEALGIKVRLVNHDGAQEAVLAAIRGDVDYVMFTPGAVLRYIASKDLIPVVVYTEKPFPGLPGVKTIGQLGFPELTELRTTYGIGAANGIPQKTMEIWRDVLKKAVEDPEFGAKVEKAGLDPADYGSAEMVEKMTKRAFEQYSKYKDLIIKKGK